MVFSDEQVREVKKQILMQVKDYPEDKRNAIEAQIDAMDAEELESFVKEQMGRPQGGGGQERGGGSQKGIFRMISDGEVPSRKVAESKDAIAVLDIRPVTKGHCVIIPKNAVGDLRVLPSSIFSLAKILGKKIVSKLNASNIEIQTEKKFGEVIINVIPVYDSPVSLNSKRYEASEEELDEVKKKISIIKKIKKEKIIKTTAKSNLRENIVKLKRPIP